MLSDALDTRSIAEALRRHGRCQVDDFLQSDAADRLHRCLADDVPWALAIHGDEGFRPLSHEQYSELGSEQRDALCRSTAENARGAGFRFVYENYEMIQAYKAGRDPGLLLHAVLEFLNGPQFLAWARLISGEPALRRVSAQATCYRPGHFLRAHDDSDPREGRQVAYVINLSRSWQADWGGLLQFLDGDRVTETFMPHWNSVSMFRVPARHQVTLVAPWAEEDRYAITGWFLT